MYIAIALALLTACVLLSADMFGLPGGRNLVGLADWKEHQK